MLPMRSGVARSPFGFDGALSGSDVFDCPICIDLSMLDVGKRLGESKLRYNVEGQRHMYMSRKYASYKQAHKGKLRG